MHFRAKFYTEIEKTKGDCKGNRAMIKYRQIRYARVLKEKLTR